MRKPKGFTLIELLIVIGIISILAAIIYVAVDPARRLAEARNAERWASTNAILNAYLKSTVDNAGTEPVTLTKATYYMIGTGADITGCTAQTTTAITDLSTSSTGNQEAVITLSISLTATSITSSKCS